MSAPPAPAARVTIRLHYDFASSLCYVTHRALARQAPEFEELGIDFDWTPLDLAALLNWRRGARVPADRLANVERVGRELDVPLRVPHRWADSRFAMAGAIVAESPERAATWRERVFSAVYDEGRAIDELDDCRWLARDLGFDLSEAGIASGLDALEARTRAAAEEEVTGVPTFMLDRWAFGGIQDDRTMLSILRRFVKQRRVS